METGFPGLISYGAPEIIDMNMLRKSEKCNVERVNNHNQKSKETGDGSHHMEVDERGIKHPYWQQSVNSDVISLTEVIPEASTDPYLRCFNNFVILIDENLIKKSPTGLLNDSAQFNKKSYKLNLTTENRFESTVIFILLTVEVIKTSIYEG